MTKNNTGEKKIYFGYNTDDDQAMHEREEKEGFKEVLAVLILSGTELTLQILSGTPADDMQIIIDSAKVHGAVEGYKKVAIIE